MNSIFRGSRGRVALAALASIALSAQFAAAQPQPGPRSGGKVEQRYYPSGDRASSALLLERITPVEVRRGEQFAYDITFTNISRSELTDLVLTEQFPPTFRVGTVAPPPTRGGGDTATWSVPRFPPGATQTLRIVGSTDQPDELSWCATVVFNTQICANTRVVEPALQLVKTAPEVVMLCDPIPMKLIVTNTGNGVARAVRITDTLPEGLTTSDGKDAIGIEVGDLAAGQSKEYTFSARAARTGSFTNVAQAAEAGGLRADASATTIVRKPELQLVKACPNLRYVGRTATFELTVNNPSDTPATNVVLVDPLPQGVEFVGADNDGRFSGGAVTWGLGTIAPGDARRVSMTVKCVSIGMVQNTASVKGYCAEASASCQMEVRGIPAILLECVDNPDPVEIGTDTTYTITVTNQGSATGTGIVVECTLPPEQQFVGANGPTQGAAQGQTIRFAPLPALAPRATATYLVTVKAIREGDVRFRVSMKSDQIDSTVDETESTRHY